MPETTLENPVLQDTEADKLLEMAHQFDATGEYEEPEIHDNRQKQLLKNHLKNPLKKLPKAAMKKAGSHRKKQKKVNLQNPKKSNRLKNPLNSRRAHTRRRKKNKRAKTKRGNKLSQKNRRYAVNERSCNSANNRLRPSARGSRSEEHTSE